MINGLFFHEVTRFPRSPSNRLSIIPFSDYRINAAVRITMTVSDNIILLLIPAKIIDCFICKLFERRVSHFYRNSESLVLVKFMTLGAVLSLIAHKPLDKIR